MTATLTGDDRTEAVTDLAATHVLKLRCLGELRRQRESGTATVSSVAKLELVVSACDRWIARYERDLA